MIIVSKREEGGVGSKGRIGEEGVLQLEECHG